MSPRLVITNKFFYYDKGYKDIWFTGYKPIEMTTDINNYVTTHEPSIVHRYYEVWDEACVTWATFTTYALAKEHARHLSGQVAHHVMYWKHFTQC